MARGKPKKQAKKPRKAPALTAQREAFAIAVANGAAQSDAYRQCFKVAPSTKSTTVDASASRLAADPKVAPRIAELQRRAIAIANQKFDCGAEEWFRDVVAIAMHDHRRLYGPDGKLKKPHELDDMTARIIEGVKFKDGELVEYRMPRRAQFYDMLAKRLRLYMGEGAVDPNDAWRAIHTLIGERGKLQPVYDVEFKEMVEKVSVNAPVVGALVPVERAEG